MKNHLTYTLLVAAMLLAGCTSHFYLVRHAERLDDSADSPLSAAGFARANALKDRLINAGIDSIFATPYIRTQQTVAPLASALGEPVIIYGTDSTWHFVRGLRRIWGKNIVVAGHSNTVPDMVRYLTGNTDSIQIAHDDYDNLFIVKRQRGLFWKKMSWIRSTYGEPSP